MLIYRPDIVLMTLADFEQIIITDFMQLWAEWLNVSNYISTVIIISLFNVDAKNKVKITIKKEIIAYIIN